MYMSMTKFVTFFCFLLSVKKLFWRKKAGNKIKNRIKFSSNISLAVIYLEYVISKLKN